MAGCKSCKKKPEIVQSTEIIETQEPLLVYDNDDIVKAYHSMTERDGIREEMKPFISSVYKQVFNEEFDFGKCASCKNNQYHKLRNYIRFHLKINI
jgi:hypothetical protein